MKKTKIITALILSLSVIFMSSCMSFVSINELTSTTANQNEISTQYNYQENPTSSNIPEVTTNSTVPVEITTGNTYIPPVNNPEITTNPPVVPEITTVPQNQTPDYSSFSKSEIIKTYETALNKTRAYTGALTVHHTEDFTAQVKEANPGGPLITQLANYIVGLVGSTGEQDLQFSGSKATNADGETIPILLPQRTNFSLPESGVASASIREENGKLHIKITLVSETVSMGKTPKYNAGSIGFLDTSDMSFSIIEISRVDISYPGSVIDAVIRSDGYVESVNYTINMSTYAELSGLGITGNGILEGAQTERWNLLW